MELEFFNGSPKIRSIYIYSSWSFNCGMANMIRLFIPITNFDIFFKGFIHPPCFTPGSSPSPWKTLTLILRKLSFFQITICGYHDVTNILAQESRLKQGPNDETWSTYLLLVSKPSIKRTPCLRSFQDGLAALPSIAVEPQSSRVVSFLSKVQLQKVAAMTANWINEKCYCSLYATIWHTYFIDICLKMGGQCSWVRMDLIRLFNLGWSKVPRFPSCTPQQSRPCTRHGKKVPGWHPQLKLASGPASSKLLIDFLMFSAGDKKIRKKSASPRFVCKWSPTPDDIIYHGCHDACIIYLVDSCCMLPLLFKTNLIQEIIVGQIFATHVAWTRHL